MAQLVERRVRNAKVRGSNPLISTTKNTSRTLFGLFYFCWGGISRLCDFSKIAPRFHRANPFGLITNEERRKRVAFADIECSFIANKSDTKCPRKAQCNARFVERRRSEKWTSSHSSLLRKRPGRFLRIPLSPPVRIQVEPLNLYSFFLLFWGN